MRKLINELKKLELLDIKSALMLLVTALPALILKMRKKNIWLIAERVTGAEDNGWIFYQWMRKNHPERNVYFILLKGISKFDENDDHMIGWATFRHYMYYQASRVHIKATFVPPRPTQRVCSYYETYIKKNIIRIYLRHGISVSGIEHHRYDVMKVRMFVCGAKPEYDYIKQYAGYPDGYVQYTGFARFDDLLEKQSDGRFILVIPTWRRYIVDLEGTAEENNMNFLASSYYQHFNSLLSNKEFIDYLESIGHKMKFCIHAEFRRFLPLFKDIDPRVEIVRGGESIHELLMSTSLLITDYSSVFFDVAYMKKPMIYYQFDYKAFRAKHFSEGYFIFERDGMGPVVHTEQDLIDKVKAYYDGKRFVNNELYLQRCAKFFPNHDNRNCERIYNSIRVIEENK